MYRFRFLRRHYPDQVCGSRASLRSSQPGITQPPDIPYSFIHARVRFVKSLRVGSCVCVRDAREHLLHFLPRGRRREDLHVRAEAEEPHVELRARDHVERDGEMLRPVGDHDHILAEAVEHRADQMVCKAQTHRALLTGEHTEHLFGVCRQVLLGKVLHALRGASSAEISVILSTR